MANVPDALFEDAYLASLYDKLTVDRGDEAYYEHLMRSAPRVLDVGCGTGTLLHKVRANGHRGRLVGIDPADGMLAQARRSRLRYAPAGGDATPTARSQASHAPHIEWLQTTLEDAGFHDEFDLIVMTGHAFQVFLTDDDIAGFFAATHVALAPGGRLAFETRNPHARAWEQWTPDHGTDIVDDDGRHVRVWHEVEKVDGEHVTFTENFAVDGRPAPIVSRSTLRFVTAEHLDHLLARAGFAIDERYGNWQRCPFTHDSPEIITVASVSPSPPPG